MTIVEAIIKVMRDAGRPLSPKESYEGIVGDGLYSFNSDKPVHVVRSQIRRHCKGFEFNSSSPRKYFQEVEVGRYAPLGNSYFHRGCSQSALSSGEKRSANKSVASQLRHMQYAYNESVKKKVLKGLKSLDPSAFEEFSKRLMEVYGFHDMEVTNISRDGGIDGRGKLKVGLSEMSVFFQCKRWKTKAIQRPEVDKFRGAIQGKCEQGVFFTTSTFTPGAKEVSFSAGAVPIILLDGNSIVDLMFEKEFGVSKESLYVYSDALDMIFDSD